MQEKNMMKILTVVAHPDDEILGCAGTIARHVSQGHEVSVLILGEGVTSRFQEREEGRKSKAFRNIKEYAVQAAKILGVKNTFLYSFPDNRFDTVPLLEIVKVIEEVKVKISPHVIYTHYYGDLNIDHRIVFDAVLTAFRPFKGESAKQIYSFETPSSTEWNYPNIFKPNVFVNIKDTINKKIEALKCYKTECREFPHPRSEEAIKSMAKRWGSAAGLEYAEAFEAVRIIHE